MPKLTFTAKELPDGRQIITLKEFNVSSPAIHAEYVQAWIDNTAEQYQNAEPETFYTQPFDKSFNAEYERAKRIGDSRYGSDCNHTSVTNGHCNNCQRRVK
jgi:hypothetical protein